MRFRFREEKLRDVEGILQAKIKDAEHYWNTYVDPVLTEAYQIYDADPEYYRRLFPALSETIGHIQTSDVLSKVEWILPSLLRIFFSTDDIVIIQGRTTEDDEPAKTMQALINWQLQVQNSAYMQFYKWFKDALITGVGFLKCYWDRLYDYKRVEEVISIGLVEFFKNDENVRGFTVLEELDNGLVRVRYEVKYPKRNQPVIEHLPPWEVIFLPDAQSLEECSFVAHRKRVSADYLRRKEREGVYKNVEEAIERGVKPYNAIFSTALSQQLGDVLFVKSKTYGERDEGNAQYWLYECYTKLDVNDDGLLEDVIVTMCNGVVLAVQENIYRRPPIFMLTPLPEPSRIWGRGLAHVIGQYQNIKTLLLRQMLLGLALANNPKLAVDVASVEITDLLNNNAFVRIKPGADPRSAVFPIINPPPNPQTLPFLEFIEVQLENESGITRYSQGLEARSLNKTATGINLIMQASNARIENIARLFAETGVTELFRFLIYLNQLFIAEETVIRLLGRTITVRPDDLKGEFDLIVNVGVGVISKQETLLALERIYNLQLQLMQFGLVTPEQLKHTVERMIEALGFKNTEAFVGGRHDAGGIPTQNTTTGFEGQGSPALLQQLMEGVLRNRSGNPIQGMDADRPNQVGGDIPNEESP